MALAQRLESLKKRHEDTEAHLHAEETRPSPDIALIQKLKREKLTLKDEITRLDAEQTVAA